MLKYGKRKGGRDLTAEAAGQDTRKGALTHHAKRGASADREAAENTAERGLNSNGYSTCNIR